MNTPNNLRLTRTVICNIFKHHIILYLLQAVTHITQYQGREVGHNPFSFVVITNKVSIYYINYIRQDDFLLLDQGIKKLKQQ